MLDEKMKTREVVISLVERYLEMSISYEQFVKNLPDEKLIVDDDALSQFVHSVGHFDDDQDIMEKEPEYKIDMEKGIRKQITKLRQ